MVWQIFLFVAVFGVFAYLTQSLMNRERFNEKRIEKLEEKIAKIESKGEEMEDGIYFDIFIVKDGKRYPAKTLPVKQVVNQLTNSLCNGIEKIIEQESES